MYALAWTLPSTTLTPSGRDSALQPSERVRPLVVTADDIFLAQPVTAAIKMALRPGSGGGSRYYNPFSKRNVPETNVVFNEMGFCYKHARGLWPEETTDTLITATLLSRQSDEMAGSLDVRCQMLSSYS